MVGDKLKIQKGDKFCRYYEALLLMLAFAMLVLTLNNSNKKITSYFRWVTLF
ncbi:putative holin-like toxin [Lactococcus ileimucosae]|uniref:putative holin-like toxin n=1 Tax=Lactococcus ileimucosae TaxID=2941329 RepID=UPI0034E03BE4